MQSPFWKLQLQSLLADQSLNSGNARFIGLEEIGRRDILVERTRLILLDPDPDQIAGNIVALRQAVQRLAAKILLADLLLEFDAVGSVSCDGPSSSESPAARSITESRLVRPEGPTP